ncbi:unnamed protein product [Linum tenue]|uniref:Uncharacterized protein n=1 Tax=Linum tenue TaxID=586396 RepID=A0AAV0QM30_9ROSI|nr:unnamed protein product [Linum tenue]
MELRCCRCIMTSNFYLSELKKRLAMLEGVVLDMQSGTKSSGSYIDNEDSFVCLAVSLLTFHVTLHPKWIYQTNQTQASSILAMESCASQGLELPRKTLLAVIKEQEFCLIDMLEALDVQLQEKSAFALGRLAQGHILMSFLAPNITRQKLLSLDMFCFIISIY